MVLSRRTLSLISAYFALCILIRVTLSQQSVCQVNDLTNDESCYNEREVICNNHTGTSHGCLPRTVNSLSYDGNGAKYTVEHGDNLPYSENSFEVVALQLCHEKAIELTLNDVTCGMTCTSEKDIYISNSFIFSCNSLPNLIEVGLTIVLFKSIPQCSDQKTKFVVIDTRDINECSQGGTYNCSDKAQCIDEKCGYSCRCITGYRMEDDNYTCVPVNCGALPPVVYGHTSTNGTIFQSVATYTCDNGYNLVGIQNRTCESNAVWSGDEPECKAVDCGDLSAVVNGVIETVATTFASVANYSCDNGYELIGPLTRMCQANGSWSDMDPLCKAVDCGNVDPPSNGAVNAPETTFQAVATFSCISGYRLVGDSIRTCQANGSWSGQIPQCNPVDCGALPPVLHGNTSTNGTVFQSVATYTCDNGYNLDGFQNRTCESNAMWSGDEPECKAIDCGDLSAVVNGVVERDATTFASVANYSCDNGYELIGPLTRMCQANGSWSDMDPLCKAVDCGNVDPPSNGAVNAPETTFQAVATFSCISGYSLVGDSIRTCQANGSWSGQIPQCNPVDCGTLPPVLYGNTSTNGTVFQSVATYTCDNGYNLDGRKNRTCESNATWSGDEPECKAVDCGFPGKPSNGEVEVTEITFESEAYYACNRGYFINGMNRRFCQANGTWSGHLPTCQIVDCGDLTAPLNGTVNMDESVYESVAMYICNDGYILMGERHRVCLANGNWSNEEPLCEPVDCGSPPVPTNGIVFSQQTIFQSTAVYSCDIGFMLFGEKRRTCEALGSWSGQTPTCKAADCGPLTAPGNGTVDVPITTYEGVAFYNCSHGYNLVGMRRRVCQANATWSSEEPVCEAVDCGPLRAPQNTIINITTTTFLSMAVYSCETGYDLNGPSTRMCQPDGSWSGLETSCTPVNCGTPPPLENGLIEVTTTTFLSGVILYKCNNGYNLEGEASRTCKSDRTWSGTQPVCTAIDCRQPSSPENGHVDVNETSFGSNAVYFCMEGYVLHGQQERECLADGNWSNEVPKCQPIDCGKLEQPIGGSVAAASTTLSSVAMYNCLVGYMLSGNRTRQCQPDGSWSGEMPQCIPVDCGQLEDPVSGKVVTTATSFKSVASYMCTEGYVLVNGSANRTCQVDAHWSGTEPLCIDVCMTEEHGCDLNTSDCISGHGNIAQRCKCKDGFQTKNDVCVKACREDGNWPQIASGCIHAIPCPTDYQGNVTRLCGEDGVWQNADNSTCENIAFMNFENEVKELFENEASDENVERVLDLVERLDRNVGVVNLTLNDLELAVDILNSTVAFLTQHLKNGGSDFSNQSVAVIGIIDQLLDNDMITLYEESNISLGETLLKSSEGYVNYLASAMGESGTTKKTINRTNIEVEALILSTDQGDEGTGNHYYPQEEPIPPGCHHLLRLLGLEPSYTPRVKIPYQLIKERARHLNSTQVPAGNAIIKNIEQLLPINRGLQRPVTSILSSQVSAADGLDQSTVLQDEPVSINFTIKDLSVSANESAKCVFWKFSSDGEGQWSSEGVTTKILDNGVVQCNSTHLTSFTVIVAINDFEIHPAYEYLTYIGVGVSLVCLFMTIIFFLSERKTLFFRVHYFVHLNLAIALFSAYLIFAVGTHFGAHKNVPCTIVAALLHFLFLAAFCWMLCEGVMLYLMLVVVFSSLSKKWWFFLILGWGPPVIFVAAGYTYGAFRGGYVDINTCWLANGGTRWFFIGPMIAIILINVIFLVIVIGSLCKNGSKDARKQMDDKGKNVQLVVSLVKASIILLPLLGATWIFGLFALDKASSYVFGTLFIVCSSLQGLFIFIFHVLRSERIWGRIKKKYGLFGSSAQSQSMTRQSTFRSSRNASFIADRKESGVKNSESCKPRHEGTNSGAVITEDGESDVNDKCEPVDLERQDQDNKSGVSIDSEPSSSLEVDVRDNTQ